MTPDARQWILALAEPVVDLVVDVSSPAALAKLGTAGSEAVQKALGSLPSDPRSDGARHAVVRKHRSELTRSGLAGWDAARFVAAFVRGMEARVVDEAVMWPRLLKLGLALQNTYKGWLQLADAYELGQRFMKGGVIDKATVARLAELRGSAWATRPWKLDLGVAGKVARARYKRSKCGLCGASKEQPSKTAYVYCDYCGELCDFDYAFARDQTASAPTPDDDRAYETTRRRLEEALATGNRALYRKLQIAQYERYVEKSAHLLSPRIADPAYRAAWVAYTADAMTAIAFDDEATRLDIALQASACNIEVVEIKQKRRIVPASFGPVIDAYLARTDRITQVYDAHDLFARHPDGLSRDLWRRIEHGLFFQQYLHLLDEDTVASLTTRLGLTADFDAVPKAKCSVLGCPQCGAELSVVAGARRILCEHCGHRHELAGR